jgi:hypothetical protein
MIAILLLPGRKDLDAFHADTDFRWVGMGSPDSTNRFFIGALSRTGKLVQDQRAHTGLRQLPG